jgi:hypothetical protein
MIIILFVHLVTTLFMTGLIWFVQVVHYPLMSLVGAEDFELYEFAHRRRTTIVVAPMMLVEAACAAALVFPPCVELAPITAWSGVCLLLIIWISTAALSIPCHECLSNGFDPRAHRRLVVSNWIRTAAWTLRSGIACYLLYVAMKSATPTFLE